MPYIIVTFNRAEAPSTVAHQPSIFTSLLAPFSYLTGTQSQPQPVTLIDAITDTLHTYFTISDTGGVYSLKLKETLQTQCIGNEQTATEVLQKHAGLNNLRILFHLDANLCVTKSSYKSEDHLDAVPAFMPHYQQRMNMNALPQTAKDEATRKGISLACQPKEDLFYLWAIQLPTTNAFPTYAGGDQFRQGVIERKYRAVGPLAEERRQAERAAYAAIGYAGFS